jgi:hypothetical protein
MNIDRDFIELGTASVETKGGTGQKIDDANGMVPTGLSDE